MKEIDKSFELEKHILKFKDEQSEIKDKAYINKKYIYTIFSMFLIIIIGLSFLLFYQDTNITKKNIKNFIEISDEENEVLGEINCVYEIYELNKKVPLFGKEFVKSSNFSVYLDSKLIEFSKDYIFYEFGKHNLRIVLYEDLNMDYMFKEVPNLSSIEMISNKNCKILSMISTFQNDVSFKYFMVNGFDAEKITSMKYCFYNSSLIKKSRRYFLYVCSYRIKLFFF